MGERRIAQNLASNYKHMIGKTYRHFKERRLYKVVNIAVHSETATVLVIYRTACYPMECWARPLDMFLSKVDRNKYPNATQEYRFELVEDV